MKKIFLNDGKSTLVSDEDFLYLSGYNWRLSARGYVVCSNGSCTVKLVTAKDKSGLTVRDFTVGRHRSLILIRTKYDCKIN